MAFCVSLASGSIVKSWRLEKGNLVEFQDSEEGFLRHLHVADFLHLLLTALLFFEEFALTAHVTSIAFCGNVFAQLLHRFAGNDFCTDGGLNRDVKLLTGEKFFEFFAHATSKIDRVVNVGQCGKRIDRFAVEENVEFHEF